MGAAMKVDQIRAEIQRRRDEYQQGADRFNVGDERIQELDELLTWIDFDGKLTGEQLTLGFEAKK